VLFDKVGVSFPNRISTGDFLSCDSSSSLRRANGGGLVLFGCVLNGCPSRHGDRLSPHPVVFFRVGTTTEQQFKLMYQSSDFQNIAKKRIRCQPKIARSRVFSHNVFPILVRPHKMFPIHKAVYSSPKPCIRSSRPWGAAQKALADCLPGRCPRFLAPVAALPAASTSSRFVTTTARPFFFEPHERLLASRALHELAAAPPFCWELALVFDFKETTQTFPYTGSIEFDACGQAVSRFSASVSEA
jgi:hypothetical protein